MTDQLPIHRTCVRCGQLTISGADVLCETCYAVLREPQGEAVRLFEPAPAQIPGQMPFLGGKDV